MALILHFKNGLSIKTKFRLLYYPLFKYATAACTTFDQTKLTTEIKHDIERYWMNKLPSNEFDEKRFENKHYVLPMFPYPSGALHMGHVRVYTISDAMARFYRLNGKNVLHPMGWDSFGLPAENAAIERKIPAEKWTKQNIAEMKEQLNMLGCSFDWSREFSTCDPEYYKWTQWIFLQLFREGLAYQREAMVNWDPVDKTVLANEQVDDNGCAWRSGAKIEKKLLKQWFLQTEKYSKQLLDGLDEIHRNDWADVIKIQKNWIGNCNGYSFNLDLFYINECIEKPNLKSINVWTEHPEELQNACFIAIKSDHILNTTNECRKLLDVAVKNPFIDGQLISVIVWDDAEFPDGCDTYIGVPAVRENDASIADHLWLQYDKNPPLAKHREGILKKARNSNIGGYLVSSKHQNWLISRQRFWGTPIPIIHCSTCGTLPVRDSDLPVLLPPTNIDDSGRTLSLNEMTDWKKVKCYKCGNEDAQRETDTCDTFFDSSWYYLRFMDPQNSDAAFSKKLTNKLAPVDLYIGGKEHAVLHLYYARFINHFLHGLGLVPQKEPFKRLIPQGMVLGQTFQVKETGKYLSSEEVTIVNEKKNQVKETATGKAVSTKWLKMSKSKNNGVVPVDLINEYSTDTIRLVMLADVAPKTARNWSKATFPGISNWQFLMWNLLSFLHKIRQDDSIAPIDADFATDFEEINSQLLQARNRSNEMVTRYIKAHLLNSAFKGPQGLSSTLRKSRKRTIKYSPQYELAIAHIIITTAPYAPHFASELWSKFITIPNRLNKDVAGINWDGDVFEQKWPQLDAEYEVDYEVKIKDDIIYTCKYPLKQMNEVTKSVALDIALKLDEVQEYANGRTPTRSYFSRRGPHVTLLLDFDQKQKQSDNDEEQEDDEIDMEEFEDVTCAKKKKKNGK